MLQIGLVLEDSIPISLGKVREWDRYAASGLVSAFVIFIMRLAASLTAC